MEESVTVETGPTESEGADGLLEIAVEDATDEEISGYLEEASSKEWVTAETQPGKQAAQSPEQGKDQHGDQPKPEPQKSAETPETAESQAEKIRRLTDELAQKEKFIKRRSTEVGELRKQNRELLARLETQAKEVEIDNPREAARIDRAIEEVKRREHQLDDEQGHLGRVSEAMQIIPKYVKPEQFDVDEMRRELKEAGMPDEFVKEFDPYTSAHPETTVFLARASYYGKALRQIVPAAQAVFEENKRLKEQLRGKGEKVLTGVQQALRKPPPMSASTSVASIPDRSPDIDPSSMSDAEIQAYLAKNSG